MTYVLHIESSPNAASLSTSVARDFLDAYARRDPGTTFETAPVWRIALPSFDETMIAAKFAVLRTQAATPEQQAHWARAVALSRSFNRADLYVFSLPMWNFGIPYRLKHYIDVVTLPGENWSWSKAEGYRPLLRHKRAVLIHTSAGDHAPASPDAGSDTDFQKPYMRRWLAFIGVEVVKEIVVAPTLADPARLAALRLAARDEALATAAAL